MGIDDWSSVVKEGTSDLNVRERHSLSCPKVVSERALRMFKRDEAFLQMAAACTEKVDEGSSVTPVTPVKLQIVDLRDWIALKGDRRQTAVLL